MWNAGLGKSQTGIKIARRNINNLRYADDVTLMAESEEELKSLLMRMKEESEKMAWNSALKKRRSWHPLAFSSVQPLSRIQLFVTPWTAACQASLPITYSQSLLKLMSIESVMPSNHLILPFSSHSQSFPASGSFQISQFFTSGGQSIGISASATVLPMNIKDSFPLGWTGWRSNQSRHITSWQIEGAKSENSDRFYFLRLQNPYRGWI